MKAMVTGGGGFLGLAIVKQLVARGDKVCSFSRGSYDELKKLGVEQRNGDISNAKDVSNAFKGGFDIVFHVAARPNPWGTYDLYYNTNVVGTENVISACKLHGIKKLVYTSSPSVIFDDKDMEGVDESVPYPRHYDAFYPKTKAIAEQMALKANSKELCTVSLRPHLIWGPGDNQLIPRLITRAKAGRVLIIGPGTNKVDGVYIDDAARAHILAADKLSPKSANAGKAYFITQGNPMPIGESINNILNAAGLPPVKRHIHPKLAYFGAFLLETIWTVLKLKSEPLVTRFLVNEMSRAHWFNISAAYRDFGYKPETPYEVGLQRLGEWLKGL
jgi:2-alkyl-3-oxoalkanoate reductase